MGGGVGARALLAATTRRQGEAAARHLIRVATGLESQVLGDGQILGQVRGAYRLAAETGAAGPVLHRLFDTALRAGKRVQSETALSLGHSSIGAASAALAMRRFGSLHRARVLVVGAGKTGQRVARQFIKLGARDLVLVNRTPTRAATFASRFGRASRRWKHCTVSWQWPNRGRRHQRRRADRVRGSTDRGATQLRNDGTAVASPRHRDAPQH